MDRRIIIFFNIILMTISVLLFTAGNYQIITALTTTINTSDNSKNEDDDESHVHGNNKNNRISKESTFSLPFNSNFADQPMKINIGKYDIIPFP
jgi:uncharacterized ion transporter superfamily protein YfcC